MFRWLLDWADRLMVPFLFLMAITFALRMHRGGDLSKVIWSDGEGYYMYLPATFIQGSWDVHDGSDGLQPILGCTVMEGKVVTRYTYGVALLQAPFFLGAHAYASTFLGKGSPPPADWGTATGEQWSAQMNQRKYSPLRGQATGFSDIYGFGVVVAAAFYMALGLFFLKRALRRSFSKEVALLATALTFLATNLFYYTAGESSMSHVYSFCLFAAVVYSLPEWLREPSWSRTLLLGTCLGLIVLIRPTNAILALLLPLWEVYSRRGLRVRWTMLWRNRIKLAGMAATGLLVMLPQGLYWKKAFGSWVAWSYGDEGFSNWWRPQVLKVLFSYQNGLFLYTPIMLFAMAGLALAWRGKKLSAPAITALFLVATYTFASWWAWWFGGAFGHRCYVEWYALLALPLAAALQPFATSPRLLLKLAGYGLALALVYANVKMAMMYTPPWDGNEWTWQRYVDVWQGVAKLSWWPGF